MWHSHPKFRVWIVQWWNLPIEGMIMFHIYRKLERIDKEVRGWRKYLFSNISKENNSTKKKCESLQSYLPQGNASTKHQ